MSKRSFSNRVKTIILSGTKDWIIIRNEKHFFNSPNTNDTSNLKIKDYWEVYHNTKRVEPDLTTKQLVEFLQDKNNWQGNKYVTVNMKDY